MVNIRIVNSKVISNTRLDIVFTANLDTDIGINNIVIKSLTGTVLDPEILSVLISEKTMTVNMRPLVARAYYQAILQSSSSQIFRGAKGENFIEDGKTNYIFFIAPEEKNDIRDLILDNIPDIYNKEPGSLIFDVIDSSANEILTTSHKIGEVESANYVSIEVSNEKMTRGSGPYDRFANEGVFQILRVGSNEEGITENKTIVFEEFPKDPVSLQQIEVLNEVISNSSEDYNKFSGLIINISNKHIIKVLSIILTHNSIDYIYNISQYGYGLLENKYDSDFAYKALDLESNQIKLSNEAIGPTFPFPHNNDTFKISYYYKKIGRNIDSESLSITKSVEIIRESVPAVSVSFFLKNAPILNNNGVVATLNGITWLDPAKNYNSTLKHPAFVYELQYNLLNMPKSIGEFTVNYETGQVFVFGINGSGTDGTTEIPPVATYTAKYTYQDGLDYVFFSDIDEIASLPNGNLRGNECTIYFNYEDTFIDGSDFNFNSHIEIINERVENRLIDTIGLYTKFGPVNEVFRIYNETTGEVYTPTRTNDNKVYFSSNTPPRTADVVREIVNFKQIIQDQLIILEELSVIGQTFKALKILLPNENIASLIGNFVGASFNSSLEFSNKNIFLREFYYDMGSSIDINLSRLQKIGDYCVNYESGIIYLAILSGSNIDVGEASYRVTEIQTRHKHIISVNDIYRSISVNSANSKIFYVGEISDETVTIENIETVGEVDIDGIPIVVDNSSVQVSSDIFELNHIFQITDLKTTYNPINFANGSVVSSSSPTNITLSSSGVEIFDNNDGYYFTVQITGTRFYITVSRILDLANSGLVQLTSAINVIDKEDGTNYFEFDSDGYVDSATNRIYLPTGTGGAYGRLVSTTYKAKLLDGAAVLVGYNTGKMFIDYTYSKDEILVSYEYGDNVLDWSISNVLSENDIYYVSYRYGALSNALRDNFGVLTGIDELSVIKENLTRETYRSAIKGSLQAFPKGPTIPSLKTLIESFTQITPKITESVFLEWVLGRDYLSLLPMKLSADENNEYPTFDVGKFGNGLLLSKSGQNAIIPTTSNLRFSEGTWEAFVIPSWNGIDNDAYLTFNIKFDGSYNTDKVYIGSSGINPVEIPFTISKFDSSVYGRPSNLHTDTGYFIWYDSTFNKWRLRARAPILESRRFTGNITTTGEFNNVKVASTADGYDGYDGYEINEINDILRSSETKVSFYFTIDNLDLLNSAYDSFDVCGVDSYAGFDGIDFSSDNIHYFFDTGLTRNKNRISLYKDGKGFIRFRVYDNNSRVKQLSANISNWKSFETHHLAISWKIGTIEMSDEIHLFIDGREVPNTYKYRGYLHAPSNAVFMDEVAEVLISSVTSPTIGNSDLITIEGSNIVVSLNSSFITDSVQVNDKFIILNDTQDGYNTRNYPYTYIKEILSENTLSLKTGTGGNYNATVSLNNIKFSINPLELHTVSNVMDEKVRVYSLTSTGFSTELFSPNTQNPDYELIQDGYQDFVIIYNGIPIGGSALLYSYGLTMARFRQNVYVWGNYKTNLLNTKLPPPTSISKINVTKIITREVVNSSDFTLISTEIGGHIVPILVSNLTFCQPSNSTIGNQLAVTLFGSDNINFDGYNRVIFIGDTADGYDSEIVYFTDYEATGITEKYFISLTDVIVSFTPIDIDSYRTFGAIEIRELSPLNWDDGDGYYANVNLSVQDQNGNNGISIIGTGKVTDAYARFGSEDIGKYFNITSPSSISGVYTITDVLLDSSQSVKDSNTVVLNTVWTDAYSGIVWKTLNTFYGDSGFANGLITLELAGEEHKPFLLEGCLYEVDFPTKLTIPWDLPPKFLYIGSDMFSKNQASAVIDEMRILDELSSDTGRGEFLPSSGRSITTDASAVREFVTTAQTLALFHFNDDLTNSANFYNNFEKSFRQSENSVNSLFGQSGIFNLKQSYQIDNKAIFKNKGSIEFWVSPIMDTYNDPTKRYYIDLTSEQQVEVVAISSLTLRLPVRAKSVNIVNVIGTVDQTNYFIGGSLSPNGYDITLGQQLPNSRRLVKVTYVPISSQGDRFSLYKSSSGFMVFSITASGTDFQIHAPIYWKKNTWHRVFIGWDLNNQSNQDRMILMIDGSELGDIIYGSGLTYGQPNVWGSAVAGTTVSRNILADINLVDTFNTIHVGADFTGEFMALARIDNMRFSNILRPITYLGGSGPGRLIGKDLLYTSNINTAQPVISDVYTNLLLDFDTVKTKVSNIATIRNAISGIFDFYVDVIDTFSLADTELVHNLITTLINRLKQSHTRAFVSFTK